MHFSRITHRLGFVVPVSMVSILLIASGSSASPSSSANPASTIRQEDSDSGSDSDSDSDSARPRTSIAGKIRLHGCVAQPRNLRVAAAPFEMLRLDDDSDDSDEPRRTRGRGVRSARVAATRDPLVFRFRVPHLRAGETYRLGIQVDPSVCRYVRWEGPDSGLVVAGSSESIVLDGWAIRSEVEVQGLAFPGREPETWVGSDHLDLTEAGAQPRFLRWKTDLPDAIEGELQIATAEFETARPTADGCAQPEGLVYRRRVSLEPDGWMELEPLDLGALLSPGQTFPPPDGRTASGATAAVAEEWIPPSAETRALIELGAPVYARVVPIRAQDGDDLGARMCDAEAYGLQGWIILVNLLGSLTVDLPPPGPPVVLDSFPDSLYLAPITSTLPANVKVCYRVIRTHTLPTTFITPDALGLKVALSSDYSFGQTLQPGEAFCVIQKGGGGGFFSSLASGFGDLVTGAIDAVSALVNGVAKLYNSIKKEAIASLASVLDALPLLDCGPGTLCRSAAAYAVEAGMTAIGLPPSLPDFDELTAQGLDYVAAEIASQANVPPVVADLATGEAKKIAAETIETMKARRGLPAANWVVVDEFIRPASLTLELSRASATAEVPDVVYIPTSTVYLDKVVPLPEKLPVAPASLTVPVALTPNLISVTPPPPLIIFGVKYAPPEPGLSRWMMSHWDSEVVSQTPCVRLEGYLFDYAAPNSPLGQVFGVDLRTKPPLFHETFADPWYSACTP